MKLILYFSMACLLFSMHAPAQQQTKVSTTPGITLYEHINFQGAQNTIFSDWSVNSGDEWNDRVSSIHVPAGYKVQIFEHLYSGSSMILTSDWSAAEDSPEAFNDIITSIRILESPIVSGITFYEHTDFAGESKTIVKDWDSSSDKNWNDRISSILVPPGYKIQVFEHSFGGASRILTGNWSATEDSPRAFNDLITSIKFLEYPGRILTAVPTVQPAPPEPILSSSKNIAIGKNVSSSSQSKWSASNDPRGAIDGIKNGGYGFHTDFDENPWVQIDLGAVMSLERIVVFNRQDKNPERSQTLQVLVSTDGLIYEKKYDRNGVPFGGVTSGKPLMVFMNDALARFVRLQLNDNNYLHLDEVEIYGVPFVSAKLIEVKEATPVVTVTKPKPQASVPPVQLPNIANGPLYIVSKINEKFFDTPDESSEGSMTVDIGKYGESQLWEVKPAKDGYVNIISLFNGLYLHHDPPVTNLLVREGQSEANQEWNVEPAGGGYFTITSRVGGKAIFHDVQKSSLFLGIKNGATNQLFKFISADEIPKPVAVPVPPVIEIVEEVVPEPEPEKTDYVVKSARSVYSTRETILVEYSGFTGQGGEWINVISKREADNEWGNFQYARGTSGELRFEWLNLSPGEYEVRAYSGGLDYTVRGRYSFTVK